MDGPTLKLIKGESSKNYTDVCMCIYVYLFVCVCVGTGGRFILVRYCYEVLKVIFGIYSFEI